MSLFATLGVNGLLGPLVQAQPPTFGVVTDDAVPIGVLWENGLLVAALPAASLDLIGAPDAGAVTTFQGKFVAVEAESPEYQGVVVSLYTRQAGGAGEVSETLALLRTNVETYREVPVSELSVVAGR